MKAFIRSWWFLGIIILFIVGVIAALTYGITTHTEPGLMRTTPGFTAADLPINVCPGGYVPDVESTRHAFSAAQAAVDVTNQRLGFDALRVSEPHDGTPGCTHGVSLLIGVPTDHASTGYPGVDPGGAALFHAGDRECAITTTNTGTDELLDLVIQHELGHCLGLDHDCWAGSIMCGGSCCTLAPTSDGQYPPRIDDSDRDLLRHVFGQR